ncbi:MAG: DUF1573 domain-containing protein [Bacteroidetes bacterium]|nr:DUF1573 domain-containing protein [Bacteroidota bacterium]
MKKLSFLIALLAFTSIQLLAQDQKPTVTLTPDGQPKIKFTESEFDFGNIEEGSKVEHVFTFINEGSAPLVIIKVETPCSCTSPSYSKDLIAPGEKGEIRIQFNSEGKAGNFTKTVTVKYNGDQSPDFITIKGVVVPPKSN